MTAAWGRGRDRRGVSKEISSCSLTPPSGDVVTDGLLRSGVVVVIDGLTKYLIRSGARAGVT
jgi:hypothetical protein